MSMTPMERIIAGVAREILVAKDAKLHVIMEAVAAELAPLIAARLKTYFSLLLNESDELSLAARYRKAIENARTKLYSLAGKPDEPVWPTIRKLLDELNDSLKENNHGRNPSSLAYLPGEAASIQDAPGS